jgi:hypothetical protein
MIRSVASKVMFVGRATTFMVGLAVIVALTVGVADAAFGANGGRLILGSLNNTATAITKLTGTVGGGPRAPHRSSTAFRSAPGHIL